MVPPLPTIGEYGVEQCGIWTRGSLDTTSRWTRGFFGKVRWTRGFVDQGFFRRAKRGDFLKKSDIELIKRNQK